jgi:hypothetical protein
MLPVNHREKLLAHPSQIFGVMSLHKKHFERFFIGCKDWSDKELQQSQYSSSET